MTEHPSTRKMRAVERRDRWLYRLSGADYGPVTTDALLEAIAARKVDMTTQVCRVAEGRWQPAGAHTLLKDHHARCATKWASEALHAEADAGIRRMNRRRHAGRGFWALVVSGIVVASAVGAWVVWRIAQAEPMGVAQLYRVPESPPLPAIPGPPVERAQLKLASGTRVRRLRERQTYDTAGIRVGDDDAARAPVKMAFDEDGRVVGLDRASLRRIMNAARGPLAACAQAAARSDRSFEGTTVTFAVVSGGLDDIGVGAEARRKPAFQACVKRALRGVSVPTFDGSPRRVSVPLEVAW